ncbi:hypothetical protein SK128_006524 [Halocaridina rubra]|uniref:Uncharacterized protein n=1 Tax=Halocaridina rubra TaxID=373956 RepID=A0AAN8WW93_HALRR
MDNNDVYSAGDVFYESLVEIGRQSTVYSFNFNNLIIIFILKMLVLLFGGGLGFGFLGRSYETEQRWLDSNDMMFIMTYLVSDGLEKYDCLNKMACLDDYKAQDLVTASSMLLKGAKYLQPFFGIDTSKYETITYGLQDAIHYKREGGSCRYKYTCNMLPSL